MKLRGLSSSSLLAASLASVLQYGTALASAMIAAGLILGVSAPQQGTASALAVASLRLITAGIVLFIFLPVVRVALMLVHFLKVRDYRFGGIAAFVLLVIFVAFVVGLRTVPLASH